MNVSVNHNNIYSILQYVAALNPSDTFINFEGQRISYREALSSINKLAFYLKKKGIGKGDRVIISMRNIPEFIYSLFAITQIGAIAVLVNNLAKRYEMKEYVNQAEPKLVITEFKLINSYMCDGVFFFNPARMLFTDCDPSLQQTVHYAIASSQESQEIEPCENDHPAIILFTSAMDGDPLGALITHTSIIQTSAYFYNEAVAREKGYFLGALPLFHSFGLATSVFIPLVCASPLFLVKKFYPKKILDILKKEKITVFCGVPLMFEVLNRYIPEGEEFPHIKLLISGGEHIDVSIEEDMLRKYKLFLHQGYGLTEASPIVTWNDPYNTGRPNKFGSVGLPMPYNEVEIWSDGKPLKEGEMGEILVKGINVTPGYFKRPDKTDEVIINGWLHTGDYGYKDEDGYLYITGIKKNMIIKYGLNVYPKEVEKILMNHPAIAACSVNRCNDTTLEAVITTKKGRDLTLESFHIWCMDNIAAYKIPERIQIKKGVN